MTSTQVVIRVDGELLESLGWLMDRCQYRNRADAILAALRELIHRERSKEIGEQIADGYRRMPQTPEELVGSDRQGFAASRADDWSALR